MESLVLEQVQVQIVKKNSKLQATTNGYNYSNCYNGKKWRHTTPEETIDFNINSIPQFSRKIVNTNSEYFKKGYRILKTIDQSMKTAKVSSLKGYKCI